MKTKQEIVDNWLPRYTGTPLEGFGKFVLLTNFGNYLELFAQETGAEIVGRDRPMPNATADGIRDGSAVGDRAESGTAAR
jgi:AMP nucleosidase